MIVVDRNALLAILENEIDALVDAEAIVLSDRLLTSVNVHGVAVVQNGAPRI